MKIKYNYKRPEYNIQRHIAYLKPLVKAVQKNYKSVGSREVKNYNKYASIDRYYGNLKWTYFIAEKEGMAFIPNVIYIDNLDKDVEYDIKQEFNEAGFKKFIYHNQ